MSQAILTRYIPATNHKPSRIKATCERGSITISYPDELDTIEAHCAAVNALVARFQKEDKAKYSTPYDKNPWARPMATEGLPSGDYSHVYLD